MVTLEFITQLMIVFSVRKKNLVFEICEDELRFSLIFWTNLRFSTLTHEVSHFPLFHLEK